MSLCNNYISLLTVMVCTDSIHEFIIAVMGSKGCYPSKETVNAPSLIDTWIREDITVSCHLRSNF